MAERAGEAIQGTGKAMRRRGLIAGAAALMVGLVAKRAAEDAPVAADGTTWTFPYTGSVGYDFTAFSVTNGGIGKGIYGSSAGNHAIYGNLLAATGSGYAGVYGISNGAGTYGVYGDGFRDSGVGVLGRSDDATGIGVQGTSSAGYPVVGKVAGTSSAGNAHAAVTGFGTAGPGVQGQSTSGYGLVGLTADTAGHAALIGYASATGGIGLIGNAPGGASPGLAGVFNGDVIVNGALRVYGSPKNAAVKHPTDNSYRLLYCEESPESWFADYGEGTLVGGKAEIKLDPDFAALIHADKYHVFLTEYENHSGLYVTGKRPSGFTVVAKDAATPSGAGTFSWRVVAKRKDIAGDRLARVAAPPPLKPVTPFTVPDTSEPKAPPKKP